jgi:hypothetical protein
MTARILRFPPRGPFAVRIEREPPAWMVIYRNHGWLFGSRSEAFASARRLADGFGVAVEWRGGGP